MSNQGSHGLSDTLTQRPGALAALLRYRGVRFVLCGGLSTLVNLILIHVLINLLRFDTMILRNIANAISIELSLLFSFFVYRKFVWPNAPSAIGDLIRQIPLYHLSAGVSAGSRILVVFPLLDWMGVHYAINTMVGIVLGAALTYLFSDRFVFVHRGVKRTT